MTNVVALSDARVERSARWSAYVKNEVEHHSVCIGEWLAMPGDERGALAESLASEIVERYSPIAKQFRALYDVVGLYLAGAQESGEDFDIAVLKALTAIMGDDRYIGLAKHIVRERGIRESKLNPVSALEIRSKIPSPVDELCNQVFSHYSGLRKK